MTRYLWQTFIFLMSFLLLSSINCQKVYNDGRIILTKKNDQELVKTSEEVFAWIFDVSYFKNNNDGSIENVLNKIKANIKYKDPAKSYEKCIKNLKVTNSRFLSNAKIPNVRQSNSSETIFINYLNTSNIKICRRKVLNDYKHIIQQYIDQSHQQESHQSFQDEYINEDGKPRVKKNTIFDNVILPGTKWCGIGNKASNDSDLGIFSNIDSCCREHDKCSISIDPLKTKYSITNNWLMPMYHCDCEFKLYNCLKKISSTSSYAKLIGLAYFKSKYQCLVYDHPLTCINGKRDNRLAEKKCDAYIQNKTEKPLWQKIYFRLSNFPKSINESYIVNDEIISVDKHNPKYVKTFKNGIVWTLNISMFENKYPEFRSSLMIRGSNCTEGKSNNDLNVTKVQECHETVRSSVYNELIRLFLDEPYIRHSISDLSTTDENDYVIINSTTILNPSKSNQFVKPGTKWCGVADVASNNIDIGEFSDMEACCREHDKCSVSIKPFETKYSITNYWWLPLYHCDCEFKLLTCLENLSEKSKHAQSIGNTYFRVKYQCIVYDYPLTCIYYDHLGGDVPSDISLPCYVYIQNKTETPLWQIVDFSIIESE